MIIMTPENFLKNLDNALKSVIVFDEKITIATVNGNAVIIRKTQYNQIIAKLIKKSL